MKQTAADRAFERLYHRHRGELYRWLLRETGDPEVAEDVLQTTFLNAYRALVDGRLPREPRSWLFAIARNANRGRFRRQRVQEAELDQDLPLSRDDSSIQELREALGVLPANQRSAIVLQEVAGLSYAEIGERLGLTVGSVQMLVFRARKRLREELVGGRRRLAGVLPLQPLANAFSRFVGSAERVGLLRGAAGIAGAVVIGGGMVATPGDASPPSRGAVGAFAQTAPVASRHDAKPSVLRSPSPPAGALRRTRHTTAPVARTAPARPAPTATADAATPPTAAGPHAKRDAPARKLPAAPPPVPALPEGVPSLPQLPQALPPLPPLPVVTPLPDVAPALPPLPVEPLPVEPPPVEPPPTPTLTPLATR